MRFNAIKGGLIVFAILVPLAAWQSRHLASNRRADLPEAYAGYSADVPPALTFVIAGLGGFRGIISEVLWFRVNRLQEEGRYLELVQLADWITMLDPHAAEAWSYNAWNLAYNVSVMMIRDEDRLRWVQSGIALLRDDGLRFNPREAKLYRELAWLYQNKIGDVLDNAHLTYKFALAETLSPYINADGTVNATAANRAALSGLHLDADRMLALEKRFGPFDWRMAEAHAVYWASQGLEFATGPERLMSRRAVYQPLILSLLHGRFTGDVAKRKWQTGSQVAFVDSTAEFMAETLKECPSKTLTFVYLKYLSVAIRLLHQEGRLDQSRILYARLTSTLPLTLAQRPTFEDVIKGWEPEDEK